MKEEVSLLQLCMLGHGFNENIYLIGENTGIGILERTLYATFSYSLDGPIGFIIIPMQSYSNKVKDEITNFFSDVIKKNDNFKWQSLTENPYNKVYDSLINSFSGSSTLINDCFIEYCIIKRS
jgi:hypothetical protein